MNAPIPHLLQDLLDRGIDPLNDPSARAWLLDHPEALESFAALRAELSSLHRTPSHRSPFASLLRPRFLLPAAGLLVGLSWLIFPRGDAAPEPTAPLPRPGFADTARVVEFAAVTTVEGAAVAGRNDSYCAVATAGNATTLRHAQLVASQPSPNVPLCTTAVASLENVLP